MEDRFFKSDAKTITDMAFDNKLFKDEITRDHMNAFEDLIAYLLKSRFDGYVRGQKLINSLPKEIIAKHQDNG